MEKNLITDETILEYYGWYIECKSPYEIRNIDGSFASGQATSCVLNSIRQEYILEKYNELMDEIGDIGVKNKILKGLNNETNL